MSLWSWVTELGDIGQESYRRETEVGVGRTLHVRGHSLEEAAIRLEPALLKKFPELQMVFYPELRKTSLERILSESEPWVQ